tara:strand:+ start:8934 stop:14147 length:5214 start_codon:yes stop_codon:yes gene_type:complete
MAQSFNASLNVQLNPQSLNQASRQVQQALGRITGQASEFQKSLDASTARVFAFGATTAVLNGVTQSFKKLVSTTIEVEKSLIEINSIFQATDASFNRFRNSIFKVAKETGQSFSTVAEGAAELARQGLNAEETASRLKSALVLTRISGLDAEKSVKALTAAINGFQSAGLKHTEIVNKMVAVDTAFAVSSQDLAEAFSRAGSTAEDAGVSFDQLLGLVTAVEQKTARGGAVIGNAFKSIFTRLARGTTIEELKELGVQIEATQSGVQKLQALSSAIENISDPTVVSKIKELAGGVFQINVVSAALKDIGNETSIFASAAKTASQATNEAFEKNRALGESLASQINEIVVGLTSLAEKVGSVTFGPLLENLIGIADKFVTFFDKALDPEKGNVFIKGFFKAIGSFLSGPALVMFTAAFVKISQLIAKFAAEGLKSLFTMGTQADRIKQIEGGIVGLLSRDENLRNQILSSTISQARKQQLVLDAIRAENTALKTQQNLLRGIAMSSHRAGVRGVTPAGGFKGRFSMGFRAEEAEARALGAPSDVRARLSDGTVKGQRVIMNNKETEIRNFAGGKDSAIIPSYAGGFIPNYVGPAGALRGAGITNMDQFRALAGSGKTRTIGGVKVTEAQAQNVFGRGGGEMRRLQLSGTGKAMLIPRLNFEGKLPKGSVGRFMKGKTSIPYELTSGVHIRGPKIPRSIDDISDPQDEQLRSNMLKDVVKNAKAFANTLYPVTGRGVSDSKITRQLLKQGGGKGALHAIIGAGFEAAVMAGLNLSPAKKKDGGDFDVRGGKVNNLADIQELFGLGASINLMDFKATASAGGKASFVKKIANEKYKNNTATMLTALGRKNKAAGYIPNFAAAGGVPTSMMRVHKDDSGSPVAVTNLRDEPNGLQDAIKRERKGIGMFAGGFIPNYFGAGMKGGQMQVGQHVASARTVIQANKKQASSSHKVAKTQDAVSDKSFALMNAFFGVQMIMGTLQAKAEQRLASEAALADEEIEKIHNTKKDNSEKLKLIMAQHKNVRAVEESTNGLRAMSEAMQSVVSSMMILSALNTFTGGGLGRGAGRLLNSRAAGRMGIGAVARRRAISSRVNKARAAGLDKAATRGAVGKGMALRSGARFAGTAGTVVLAGMAAQQALSKQGSFAERQQAAAMGGGGVLGGAAAGAAGGAIAGPKGAIVGAIIGALGGTQLGKMMTGQATEKEAAAQQKAFKIGQAGLGKEGFDKALIDTGQLIARGIDPAVFKTMNAAAQKAALELDETADGAAANQKAVTEYVAALEEARKAAAGEGISVISDLSGKKRAAAREKANENLQKKALALSGRKYMAEWKQTKFEEELSQTTRDLTKARKRLSDALNIEDIGLARMLVDESAMQETDMGRRDMLSKVAQNTPLGSSVARMTKAGSMLAGINTDASIKREAEVQLDAKRRGITTTDSRTPAQLKEAIEESSDNLKEKIEKAATFFESTFTAIAQEQKQVQQQLDQVTLGIIGRATDLIKTRVAGEFDFDNMMGDASVVTNMVQKILRGGEAAEGVDRGALRNRIAEFDDRGLGIDLAQFVSEMSGIDLTKISEVFAKASTAGLMSPDEIAAAQGPNADPELKRRYQGLLLIQEENINKDKEIQDELVLKKKGLAESMTRLTTMYNEMTEGESATTEGKNVGQQMKEFAAKIRDAGTSLDGFKSFSDNIAGSTTKTAELISSVTELTEDAVSTIKGLSKEVTRLQGAVGNLLAEEDPLKLNIK